MAKILDFEYEHEWDMGSLSYEIKTRPLPAGQYCAIAIGPNSEHDLVRVQFPGVDARLGRGMVLPLPADAWEQMSFVTVAPVRAYSGRLQLIAFEYPEEVEVSPVRAPGLIESTFELDVGALKDRIDIIVPYGGRSAVNLTASIGGANPLVGPAGMSVEVFGRIYNTVILQGSVFFGGVPYVQYPLNQPAWTNTMRDFSWNEFEKEFDEIVFNFRIAAGVQEVWYRTETRD